MEKNVYSKEVDLQARNGIGMLFLCILLQLLAIVAVIVGVALIINRGVTPVGGVVVAVGAIYTCFGWISFLGLKILKPQEALVLTLFGEYIGTLKGEGFYYVNPFSSAVNSAAGKGMATASEDQNPISIPGASSNINVNLNEMLSKKISLKTMTLNNNKQKVNDALGNPIEIGIVVIWRIVNTAKAVFNVDNYKAFLSIQSDSALRNIARLYPYDVAEGGEELSLRGSSQEVADKLKTEIQERVEIAGIEVIEARITHLAYAPEIAAAMLQRQQAAAVIDARKMIVDGAVGMVEMALEKLSEKDIVQLDDERKAAMVSNLLVVLCGNRDAQPIVNSGTIY